MGFIIKKEGADTGDDDWLCVSCGFVRGDRVAKPGFREINPGSEKLTPEKIPCQPQSVLR